MPALTGFAHHGGQQLGTMEPFPHLALLALGEVGDHTDDALGAGGLQAYTMIRSSMMVVVYIPAAQGQRPAGRASDFLPWPLSQSQLSISKMPHPLSQEGSRHTEETNTTLLRPPSEAPTLPQPMTQLPFPPRTALFTPVYSGQSSRGIPSCPPVQTPAASHTHCCPGWGPPPQRMATAAPIRSPPFPLSLALCLQPLSE